MRNRLRRNLSNIILAALSTVFSLAVAEAATRLLFPPPEIVHVELDRKERSNPRRLELLNRLITWPETEAKGLHTFTPLGKRMNPNVVATLEKSRFSREKIVFRTNSLGYRNRELGKKKGKRILFIGDSITFGFMVNEKDTFVRLIEKLAATEKRELETVNAGIQGTGLENYLSVLIESGIGTKPDLVLVGLYLNDYEPSQGIRIMNVPGPLANSWFLHYLFNAISRIRYEFEKDKQLSYEINYSAILEWRAQVQREYPGGEGDPRRDRPAFNRLLHKSDYGIGWNKNAWRPMIPIFRELKRQSVLNKFGLVMVIFPVRPQVWAEFLDDRPQRILKKMAADQGIPALDLLPLIRREYRAGGGPLYYDHCHYNARGNRLIARLVYHYLKGFL